MCFKEIEFFNQIFNGYFGRILHSILNIIGVTYMIIKENKIFASITNKLFIQDLKFMRKMDTAFTWIY